jgi:hypothetical protein
MFRSTLIRRAFLAGAILALAACGGSPTDVQSPSLQPSYNGFGFGSGNRTGSDSTAVTTEAAASTDATATMTCAAGFGFGSGNVVSPAPCSDPGY